MASAAWLGQGSLLQLDDGIGNFTTISEIKTINGPDEKRALVDVTSHSSSGQRREFINGLIDGGSLRFDGVWLPVDPSQNGTTGFYSVFNSGVRRNYKILLSNPQSTVVSLSGLAMTHSKVIPIDKEASFTGEVKVTGVVTIA
jgi:hypothetical protein